MTEAQIIDAFIVTLRAHDLITLFAVVVAFGFGFTWGRQTMQPNPFEVTK